MKPKCLAVNRRFTTGVVAAVFIAITALPMLHAQDKSEAVQKELKLIDAELAILNQELDKEREDELNENMLAQPKMRYNWGEFVEHIQESAKDFKDVNKLKEQIGALNSRREVLLEPEHQKTEVKHK